MAFNYVKFLGLLSIVLIATTSAIYYSVYKLNPGISPEDPEIYWDWSTIDENDLDFPDGFYFGTGTAAYNVEGYTTNNQWSLYEKKPGFIHAGDLNGNASDHWNLYGLDVDLMKNELHANIYRFNFEWSKIEPKQGQFDMKVVQHYHDMLDTVIKAGMKPVITLHVFTDPIWFFEMGSFEKEENIKYFLAYAKFIYEQFHTKVQTWCTINEPQVYALIGYLAGYFPPQKTDPQLATVVLKNVLEAHTQVYHSYKKMPGGEKTEIGITLNMMQFDPYSHYNPIERVATDIVSLFHRDCIMNFLKTGTFKVHIPFLVNVYHHNPDAARSLDFFGLNYYSNMHIKFQPSKLFTEPLANVSKPGRPLTDMGWYIYPEGLYRSLKLVTNTFGEQLPIYVTECGIADMADKYRERFIRTYFYALSHSIKQGIKVKGFTYWATMDNWEWRESRTKKFGLYHVDFATQKRTLYPGSKAFAEIVQRFRKKE